MEQLLNSMWHWRVLSITAPQPYPDRLHPCPLPWHWWISISATTAKEIFSEYNIFLPFLLNKRCVYRAFFLKLLLTPSNLFLPSMSAFPCFYKDTLSNVLPLPSGTLNSFPELDKEYVKIILLCLYYLLPTQASVLATWLKQPCLFAGLQITFRVRSTNWGTLILDWYWSSLASTSRTLSYHQQLAFEQLQFATFLTEVSEQEGWWQTFWLATSCVFCLNNTVAVWISLQAVGLLCCLP